MGESVNLKHPAFADTPLTLAIRPVRGCVLSDMVAPARSRLHGNTNAPLGIGGMMTEGKVESALLSNVENPLLPRLGPWTNPDVHLTGCGQAGIDINHALRVRAIQAHSNDPVVEYPFKDFASLPAL